MTGYRMGLGHSRIITSVIDPPTIISKVLQRQHKRTQVRPSTVILYRGP